MDSPATYVHFWFISISVPNLLLILGMIAVFVIALLAPFPRHRTVSAPLAPASLPRQAEPAPGDGNWTNKLRGVITRSWPWHQLLPDRQPSFVGSWVYVFGVGAIAALVWIIVSGVILVIFGPTWWHVSSTGKFVNSIHFWSVQLFFACTVIHLWGQYFMAGWRHGRALTWIVGVVIFAIAIGAAFTGYLSQQNFDAQWIALNAKDAVNSTGVGSFFNVLDYGQMFGIHVMLLPLGVVSLVGVHVLLVRLKGVVRPIGDEAQVKAISDAEGGKS
ncbi:MAG: cytochrome b N-terminal domain-containing protein [Candidatus Limnocylindrales bacterium]